MTSHEHLSLEKTNAINAFMPFWNLVEKVKTFHFLNFILDVYIKFLKKVEEMDNIDMFN